MATGLPRDLNELLREVIAKRQPDMVGLLLSPLLDEHSRQFLRDLVADELCETGLQENSEPNARGLQLEEIIDRLGHL